MRHKPVHCRTPRKRSGFTALELVLGLSVSALLGICLVGLVSSAAIGWNVTGDGTAADSGGDRGAAYVEKALRSAQDVGYAAPGSASEAATLLLWAHDLYQQDGIIARDRTPQRAELLLFKYDPTSKSLNLYRPKRWLDMTASERAAAATTLTTSDLTLKATADAFAAWGAVQKFKLLGGAKTSVTAVSFWVENNSGRPIVAYEIELDRAGMPAVRRRRQVWS